MGGHVRGSARFHSDKTFGFVPLAIELPVWSSSFKYTTLFTGSSLMKLFERLESPKKYVPSPDIVAAASVVEVSKVFLLSLKKFCQD